MKQVFLTVIIPLVTLTFKRLIFNAPSIEVMGHKIRSHSFVQKCFQKFI